MTTLSATRGHATAVPDKVGIVKFYCAVWGRGGDTDNVDLMGDVLDRHSFDRDVKARQASGARLPILWSHSERSDVFEAIGYADANEGGIILDDHGCLITAVLDLTNETASRVYKHCQQGIVDQASFRYTVRDEQRIKTGKFSGANLLLDCTLEEASLTLFGANQLSSVMETKSAKIDGVSRKTMSAEIEYLYSYTDAAYIEKAARELDGYAAKLHGVTGDDVCNTCSKALPPAVQWPRGYGYYASACLDCMDEICFDMADSAELSTEQIVIEARRIMKHIDHYVAETKQRAFARSAWAAEGKAAYRANKARFMVEDLALATAQHDEIVKMEQYLGAKSAPVDFDVAAIESANHRADGGFYR